MRKIDNMNMSDFESDVVINEVIKCIKIASEHNGKVYGGFVRDYVVPSKNNIKPKNVAFNDVDIWFKYVCDAEKFINKMGRRIVRDRLDKIVAGEYPMSEEKEFSRRKYDLVKYNTCLTSIDVIVSYDLPNEDFDVNSVTYSIDSNGKWVTTSPNYLIKQIQDKRANMLPICKLIITSDSYNKYYDERIERIFIAKGWEVFVPIKYETYKTTINK
jgi:hypothetical protein